MRISADRTNPAFMPEAFRATVYLDGWKVKNCIAANDELGHVIVYATDDKGGLIVDESTGDAMVQMIEGEVKIELSDVTRL